MGFFFQDIKLPDQDYLYKLEKVLRGYILSTYHAYTKVIFISTKINGFEIFGV